MDILIGVIVGLIVLMFLVTAHEFGHFLAARRNGVNVLEFGIGFPPRIVAWMKDIHTGKWRRLPRSEWEKEKATKVVYSDGENKKFAQKGMVFSLNWWVLSDGWRVGRRHQEGDFWRGEFLVKDQDIVCWRSNELVSSDCDFYHTSLDGNAGVFG